MSRTLDNKVALITGAGQGSGQGIAFSLASRGVRVIAVGRTLDKCEHTVKEIKRRFDQDAAALQCDISDLSALDQLVTEACTVYGRLDILVNNAVSTTVKPLLNVDVSE